MFIINIKKFYHDLHLTTHSAEKTPSESGIIITYEEDDDLTKHEILKRFNNSLVSANLTWIRPLDKLTKEWVIDLKLMKHSFEMLNNTKYLHSKITIEPEYFQDKTYDAKENEEVVKSTKILFKIYPDDVNQSFYDIEIDDELKQPLKRFKKDYPDPKKCCFLIMKFEDSRLQSELVKALKEEFQKRGLFLLRADDKVYSDDLFQNIKTYMHYCSFGLALFERINSNYFNPNVSLEVGYMMALKKPILFLKDRTLDSLHSDLIGKLYYSIDVQNIETSIPSIVDKWLTDKEII